MGNAQSTDGSRRTTQRLSKPRTGNHASPGRLSSGVFSSSRSRRLSNAQPPGPLELSPTTSSTPTTSSAPETAADGPGSHIANVAPFPPAPVSQEQLKRRSLFRSRSTRDDGTTRQAYNGGGQGSQLTNRTSRASSMTYEPPVACYGQAVSETRPAQSDARAPVNYNFSSYEARRLLNLAEEPHFERAATMSDNVMAVTETTWNPCNQANTPSSPISRTSSDVSLYMPVRRRSMIQTPGVATRSSLVHDVPPVPRVAARYSLPVTPSLSRQQSIESYRNGAMPTEPRIAESESAPRVATPCEDDYLSIGAFKLGSLRITNGFPSPVTPDVDEDEDEKGGRETHPMAMQEVCSVKSQNSETGTAPAAAVQSDAWLAKVVPEMSHSPSPPTAPERPTSQELQATSENAVLDDQLLNDDEQPEYSSVEVLDVRPDPNAKPPHGQLAHSTDSGVKRADSGFASTGSPSSESCCKLLAKADSGYSSNVSLRSFQAKAHGVENQPNASPLEQQSSRLSNESAEDQVGSSPQDSSDQLNELRSANLEIESLPPPIPPKDIARYSFDSRRRPGSITNNAPTHDFSSEGRSKMPNAAKDVPNTTITVPPDNEWPLPAKAEARGPESVSSPTSGKPSSPQSVSGGIQKPSRLQRLFSGARRATISAPTVGTLHAFEDDRIPPVPKETEQKLRGRQSRGHSTPKKPVPRSRPSLDTLKTIFSVGSLEASLDAVNTMQPKTTASGSENKEGAWKQGLQSVPASLANFAGHVIPRRTKSGKSVRVDPGKTAQDSQAGKNRSKNASRGDVHRADISSPVSPPQSERGKRTMSLTVEAERGITRNCRTVDTNVNLSPLQSLPSPALPSPVAKAMAAESSNRVPETVHSIRRSQMLHVPPSLGRKTSRESLQSNPAAHPSLARKTSLNSIRSYYHSSQASVGCSPTYSRTQSLVSMDPRRFQSFRQYSLEPSAYSSPTREVYGNFAHGTSQTLPGNEARRNSISSVRSEGIYRSVDARRWHVQVPYPQLRHRTSFERYHGYEQWYPHYGYPPSMSNGYTAPIRKDYDPCSGEQIMAAAAAWNRGQFDAAAGQWYQGQNLRYGSRGHSRSSSMESRAVQVPNPPYRVLHSYNSPAYRHAPIWG